MILLAILVFIIILGLLVFVHELGHFVMAKRAGMRVDEFGFGFPPRLFGIKRGETTYSINLIPLGGFVRIVGEDGTDSVDPESFGNKSAWRRFGVLIAGVTMNVILAWVLISIGVGLGLPTVVGEGEQLPKGAQIKNVSIGVLEVAASSPAAEAGVKIGDTILKINNQPITSIEQAQSATLAQAGKITDYTVKRGSELIDKKITPRVNPPEGQGPLGIALGSIGFVSYPWYQAPFRGAAAVASLIWLTLSAFGGLFAQLFAGQNVGAALSGPIGIAVLTKDVTALGFIYLLQFTAILSVNLAIINAIPFPALDGGRVLFLIIEKIRGRKLDQRVEQWANTAGFVLLLMLMVAVTIGDVGHYSQQFKNLFHRIF